LRRGCHKSDTRDGNYIKVGTVPGKVNGVVNSSYTITGLESGVQAYFKVSAISVTSKEGIASKPIPIIPVEVRSISISNQPELNYISGNRLDLTDLAVAVEYSDGQIDNIEYVDFSRNNLTTDIPDQKVLDTYDTGKKITVTYKYGNKVLSAKTREISVLAEGSGSINANIVFSYSQYDEKDLLPKQVIQNGSTVIIPPNIQWDTLSRATEVTPGKTLYAYAVIKNNTNEPQDILVILALYDQDGSMVAMNSLGRKIGGGDTKAYSLSVDIPSEIGQYSAKALVWDGTSISTTKQTPKAYPVQLQ